MSNIKGLVGKASPFIIFISLMLAALLLTPSITVEGATGGQGHPAVDFVNIANDTTLILTGDSKSKYRSGFHCFLSEQAAQEYKLRDNEVVIPIRIKKSWITEIGFEEIRGKNKNRVTIVAKKAIFPKATK